MATIKLSVTVTGGIPPVSIRVNLFKDDVVIQTHSFDSSFDKSFTGLKAGSYSLFVGGFNPINTNDPALPKPATKCEIDTGTATLNPPDNSPTTKRGKAYLVQFHFTV